MDVTAHGGRYLLGELLGRGGMAEVFAGRSSGAHGFWKPVAIKRLLPGLASDHVFVERLIQEAKLLVGMQHGNIVSVIDLARDGNDVFLVMEFVDGPSLRQLVKARGAHALPLGVATHVIQAAATGLEFAHSSRGGAVIHTDISPSNILLTAAGEVRVADFGIARREGAGPGPIEGKWAYMPPEQARGEALRPNADVFALGVVLHELITGRHPFGPAILPTRRDHAAVSARAIAPEVPLGLDEVCARALAADPRERYPRMQDLIDALVDVRYAHAWREGASDLARIVAESRLGGATLPHDTAVTGRPLTIATRSLIPPAEDPRGSQPAIAEVSAARRSQARATTDVVTGTHPVRIALTALGLAAAAGVLTALAMREPAPDDEPGPPSPSVAIAPAAPPAPAPEPPARVEPPAVVDPAPVAPPVVERHTHNRVAAPARPVHHPSAPRNDAVLRIRTRGEIAAKITIAGGEATIHGEAADGRFALTPGTYHVMLSNQDRDLWVDCGKRSVVAGKLTTLVADMEDKDCWIDP